MSLLPATLLLLAQVLVHAAKIHEYQLPPYVERACKRDDPNLDLCVVEVGNKAVKAVTKGDAKYRIPRLEPLVIPEIRIRQGTAQVGVYLVMRNVSMTGLENAILTAAKSDFKGQKATWKFYMEHLGMSGRYNITGKVLLLPIVGDGVAQVDIQKLNFSYQFSWDLPKKANNLEYVKVKNYSLTHEIGGMKMHLGNLFNGDKLLGENMNRFLNENWRELLAEVGPAVADALAEVFTTTLNAMGDVIPWDNMFPK